MIGFLILMALLGMPYLGVAIYLGFTLLPIILGLGVIVLISSFLGNVLFPPKGPRV